MEVFVVTYDIASDERRRGVFEALKRWGYHVQYAVFWCRLGEAPLARLRAELDRLVHHEEDQVLFFSLGPDEGRAAQAISGIGRPFHPPEHKAEVI